MKKPICLILALCLSLSLCACGDSPAPAASGESSTQAPVSQSTAATTTEAVTEAPVTETTEAPVETEPPFVPQGKVELVSEPMPAGYTLKELGPVADGEGTLTFRSDDLLVRYEKDENGNTLYLPVDHMGKQISNERYGYFEELLPGLFLVSSLEDSVNNTGLMNEDGEMLIPCECAIITDCTMENTDGAKSQFLRVIYATEETENEDEAFFFASNAYFSLHPEEGDKLYKGYAKIYDLENKCFVPELTITNPNKFDTSFGGGLIYVQTEDDEKLLYNAAGRELFKSSDYVGIDIGDGFYVIDYTQVFDTDGNLLFERGDDDSLQIIRGSARFLSCYNYDAKLLSVYDYYGNKLFELAEGPNVMSAEANGCFAASVDGKAIVYNAQGAELCAKDACSTPSYVGYGIWMFSPQDTEANSSYYLPDGSFVEGERRYLYQMINEVSQGDDKHFSFHPWSKPTETVSVETTYADNLTDALIACDGNGKTLVDCFSGETLMHADGFEFANSRYVYAKLDGVYRVYELTLK